MDKRDSLKFNMKTLLLPPTKKSLVVASGILEDGGMVAFPTETVYGLGADSFNVKAVAKVFKVKGRPSSNPLIVHVKDLEMASELALFDDTSRHLAKIFWPGPLTLILPIKKSSKIPDIVTANSGYIALRIPSNAIMHNLIGLFGKPIVGPSANLSGKISSTSPNHVLSDFNGKIDAIIDGKDCPMGLESTILMCDHAKIRILRLGFVTKKEISEKLSDLNIESCLEGESVPSPGSKFRHYSPETSIVINCQEKGKDDILIGFGESADAEFNLSEKGDLVEAAKNLYHVLREADQKAQSANSMRIIVSPVPNSGLGLTINDRLERAARKD